MGMTEFGRALRELWVHPSMRPTVTVKRSLRITRIDDITPLES